MKTFPESRIIESENYIFFILMSLFYIKIRIMH